MTRRIISLLVAAMMVLALIPAAAFAKTEAPNGNAGIARDPIGRVTDLAPRGEKAAPTKSIASWDFEEDPLENGWTFRNDDGDSFNWAWTTHSCHSYSHSIISESYISGYGAQNPDQWAISPEFHVPETGASVSFWVKNYSSSYPDNFSIYVYWIGEGPDPIEENITVEGSDWVQLTYNLPSAVNGDNIAFAIRHHNSYNQWALFIDDIVISEPIDETVITEVDVSGIPTRFYIGDYGPDLAEDIHVPADANYEVTQVMLVNDADYNVIGEEGYIEADTEYNFQFIVEPLEGYHFSEDATLTANGGALALVPESGVMSETRVFMNVEPMTARTGRPIFGWYFESDEELEGWSALDNDGDGYNWFWAYGEYAAPDAYEGAGWMGSYSYYSGLSKQALTPDNYLFTPAIELPEGESTLSFFAAGLDSSYCKEHFAVYIAPADAENLSQLVEIMPETETGRRYTNYCVDLTEYAGQEVIIAFRHFNCTDMYTLRLDQVEIFEGIIEPIEPPIVSKIEINDFIEPEWNAQIDLGYSLPEDVHYSVYRTTWYYWDPETNSDYEMAEGDLFDNPDVYYYRCYVLICDEGYDFDIPEIDMPQKDLSVLINGGTKYVANTSFSECNTALYVYTIDFQVGPNDIESIDIIDFVEPSWYANPDYNAAVPDDAHYSITDMEWCMRVGEEYTLLDEESVFDDPEAYYFAVFNLEAEEGYNFRLPGLNIYTKKLSVVTINGSEDYVAEAFDPGDMTATVVTIEFQVAEPEPIETIEINDFAVPKYGAAPFYGVTVPEDAHYSIEYTDWNWWSDVISSGGIMTDGELFDDPSSVYWQHFKVVPDEGYEFADEDEMTVLINGSDEYVDSFSDMDEYYSVRTVEFEVENPVQYITAVEIEGFTVPEWGANPDLDCTVPDGAHYTISYTEWDFFGGGFFGVMDPADVYDNPVPQYVQYFEIIPEEGWIFAEDVTVTINGSTEYVDPSGYGYQGGVSPYFYVNTIGFYVTEPEPELITEANVIELEIPEWGAHPDFDVSVPEGAHYTVTEITWEEYVTETGDTIMLPGDNFINLDAEYHVIFVLDPEEGWVFSEECVTMINGDEGLVDFSSVSDGRLYIASVDFTVYAEPIITHLGDVNLNGTVEVADAILAMRYAMGLVDLNEEQLYQCEVSGNGVYDLVDATLILRFAMNLIDGFPADPEPIWPPIAD